MRRARKVNEYNDTTPKIVSGPDILINYFPRQLCLPHKKFYVAS